MKKLFLTLAIALSAFGIQAKTIVVYYSYTNNIESIVNDLTTQIEADVLEIEPAEKGLDYAANGYAIGSAQIAAIRNNPDDLSSYPAIDPVNVDLAQYSTIFIGAPLWWSNMAAPLQTFLFQYGKEMAGKKVGLVVSSASSGISGVEADAKRLIPEGDFIAPSLWIRSSQTSNCHSMLADWLNEIHYNDLATAIEPIPSDSMNARITVSAGNISVTGVYRNVSIYKINGEKVIETQQSPISTSDLKTGMYLAVITDANLHHTSHKLIVK